MNLHIVVDPQETVAVVREGSGAESQHQKNGSEFHQKQYMPGNRRVVSRTMHNR